MFEPFLLKLYVFLFDVSTNDFIMIAWYLYWFQFYENCYELQNQGKDLTNFWFDQVVNE